MSHAQTTKSIGCRIIRLRPADYGTNGVNVTQTLLSAHRALYSG